MKYVYATIYSVATLFIMTLVVTENPFLHSPTPLGILAIIGAGALVFAGTVGVMSWSQNQTTEVTMTDFQVKRALHVLGLKDEGAHFYLELEKGGLLFLSGETLEVYALHEGFTGGKLFPNSAFSLLKNVDGTILGLAIQGAYLQPEEILLADEQAYTDALSLKNGDVLPDGIYEDVKRRIGEAKLGSTQHN